jgi:phage terminase large subunit-like protein
MTTEGNVVHYGYIEKFIERLGENFNIREIAFDRRGAVQMVQNLEGMGFTVVPFGQGFKDMSPHTIRCGNDTGASVYDSLSLLSI